MTPALIGAASSSGDFSVCVSRLCVSQATACVIILLSSALYSLLPYQLYFPFSYCFFVVFFSVQSNFFEVKVPRTQRGVTKPPKHCLSAVTSASAGELGRRTGQNREAEKRKAASPARRSEEDAGGGRSPTPTAHEGIAPREKLRRTILLRTTSSFFANIYKLYCQISALIKPWLFP